MARFLLIAGILLILLPIPVCGLELLIATLTHATGEARASAGFWAVWVGFMSIPLGVISMFLGLIVWGFQR